MLMPETAMNEDDRSVAREDYIRATGQVAAMESKTESLGIEEGPYQTFGGSIPLTNARHDPAPHFFGDSISHLSNCIAFVLLFTEQDQFYRFLVGVFGCDSHHCVS